MRENSPKKLVPIASVTPLAPVDNNNVPSLSNSFSSSVGNDEMKEDFRNIMSVLEEHSKQLSQLFQNKADLTAIDNLLQEKEPQVINAPIIPPSADADEVKLLKESMNKKVSREELEKMKKIIEKEITTIVNHLTGGFPSEKVKDGIAVRVHYRCLACDRIIWRIGAPNFGTSLTTTSISHTHDTTVRPRTVDGSLKNSNLVDIPIRSLAPNIAFRRWQVKQVFRHQQVEELQKLNANEPTKSKRRNLTPIIKEPISNIKGNSLKKSDNLVTIGEDDKNNTL